MKKSLIFLFVILFLFISVYSQRASFVSSFFSDDTADVGDSLFAQDNTFFVPLGSSLFNTQTLVVLCITYVLSITAGIVFSFSYRRPHIFHQISLQFLDLPPPFFS